MPTLNYAPRPDEPRIGASATSLVLANFLTIALALYESWDLRELMIIYWSQSVIIGFFSFWRMRDLKEFSTEGVSSNGNALEPTPETKRNMSNFFALHYGAFHFIYLVFLFVDRNEPVGEDVLLIGLCIAGFLVNHWYSYAKHRDMDALRKPNIGTIMFFPYARIVPMHLTIIAGGAIAGASPFLLLLFLGLKTLADVIMHKIEHTAWHKGDVTVANSDESLQQPIEN